MRKKIALSLFTIFIFFTVGIGVAIRYISLTTEKLNNVIKLHQVEELRRSLVISLQTVQTDLLTIRTSLGHDVNSMIENVVILENAASRCSSCHHSPSVSSKIKEVQATVKDYKKALSYYVTKRINNERSAPLMIEAARIGNTIFSMTAEMSHVATRKLENFTSNTVSKIDGVKNILYITLLLTLLLAVIVSFRLANGVTVPIDKLLKATRRIASGEYGHTIHLTDTTEFNELAQNYNRMSIAIQESYKGMHNEINKSIKTESELRASQERYSLAARGANDGLWDWELHINRIYFSSRWKSMIGYKNYEIKDTPEEWFSRIHPDDMDHVESEISLNIKGLAPHFRSEYRLLHKNGTYLWMLCRGVALMDDSGKACRMAGSQTDITERKVAEEQLMHDAFHDILTGLPNRALFMDRLNHASRRAARHNSYMFAVLFVDMDRFKVINDSLGHTVGDQLLVAVSKRLEECLRPGETVARLGGDEFAILLEDLSDKDSVKLIIKRIQKKMELPFDLEGHEVFITASIGISFGSAEYEVSEHILRDADIAMYQAKMNGRARYEFFDKGMHLYLVSRLKLETELRRAIDNNEFELYYQPIVVLKTMEIIGFEALVRWKHPEKGIMGPLEFISVAEDTGLINTLGEWIIKEACLQLSSWQEQFKDYSPLSVSVNISSKQFNPELVDTVCEILKMTGVKKGSIIFEITESMIMENANSAIVLMQELKELGVRLHIDDFGTGYSSLSYLHHFPLDALKIDRSFINNMGKEGENMEIVKTITDLANNLNLEVIAEGVETDYQLSQLKTLECKNMQGFLISRPMNSEAARSFIREKLSRKKSI